MSRSDEIKKLFDDYHKAHPDESVISDGIVTEDYCSDECYNILFILKESNISGGNLKSGVNNYFWFKEVYKMKSITPSTYYGNNLNRVEKSAQTKYFNCITQIVEEIRKAENIDDNTKIGISYININKNGGGSTCDNIGIVDWLVTGCKHQFLLKQIKKIKPNKIVIFSCNNSNPNIKKFAEELNSKYSVIKKEYHPSRYKKK